MNKYLKYLLIKLLFISSLTLVAADQKDLSFNEIICKSTTVRSLKEFNQLKKCTVVAGHVRIVQMHFTPALMAQIEPSNIEEITDYLLVYRVEGLDSLESLFPKLIVIRGIELLYDKYALVVNENRELKTVGLVSLLRILRGSIRVESNPSLCYTHTINWVSILGDNTHKYVHVIKNNKPQDQCPLCYTCEDEIESIQQDLHKNCWSLNKFQRFTTDYNEGQKCNKQGRGVSNCLTSCSDNNCRHCTNYVTDKGCVNYCLPPKLRLAYKRQCVSDCNQLGLIPFGMECVEKCPKHYQQVTQNDRIICAINCTGNFKVNTMEDLEGFSECTIIQGSLTIELFEINKPVINNLAQAFTNLNEITGFLRIQRSPQIVSLNFFKNLHTIRGADLIENTYSFYVVDNYHLEELWNNNQQVAILHGRVYFHLNPHLCYSKIMDLQTILKESPKITVNDASQNSNGERVVCGDVVRELSAEVTDYNSTSALIVHEALDLEDLYLLLGYIYYYKEAPYRNVTKYDGRHGCGQDSWFIDITQSKLRRHNLKDLKPATQYAFFVKTMTLVDYHYQMDATSEIKYFRTLPAKPGPVAKFYSHAVSTNKIEIYWWPPRQANGIIEKYLVDYEITNITMPTGSNAPHTQNREELCQCPKLETELSGATPNEEDYYKKEDIIFIDAMTNFIIRRDDSKINATKKVKSMIANVTTLEELLAAIQEKAIKTQDLEEDTFEIVHSNPICNQSNPKTQYQSENKCIPLDNYDDSIKISGQRHTYTLSNLNPGITYRISIRACVANLPNGCGPARVILAETVSQRLESFLETLNFYKQ